MVQTKVTRTKDPRHDLLEAAIYLFGHYGYDGVTTRMIVARAGVNISTLHYYYKSKQELYDAIIRHIATFVNTGIAEPLRGARQLLDMASVEIKKIQVALIDLMQALVRKLITKEPLNFGLIVIREQIMPSHSFDILFNESLWPIHQTIERLIARLTDRLSDDEHVILEAHALLGQVLGFLATRTMVLRIMKQKSYTNALAEKICHVIEVNIQKLYGNNEEES